MKKVIKPLWPKIWKSHQKSHQFSRKKISFVTETLCKSHQILRNIADLHRFTEGLLISRPVNYEGAPLSALENVGGALENVGKFLYFFFFLEIQEKRKSVEKSHYFLNKNHYFLNKKCWKKPLFSQQKRRKIDAQIKWN